MSYRSIAARILPVAALVSFALGIPPASAAGPLSLRPHVGVRPRGGDAAEATSPGNPTGPGGVWVDVKEFDKKQLIIAAGAKVTGLGQVGSFSDPERVPGSRYGSFGDIVVGPQGQVMVTYQDPTGDQGPSTISTNVDPD